MFDRSVMAQGFALGLGMLVCPGPKDILLIGIGVAGISATIVGTPSLHQAALAPGVGLMLLHAGLAARRALWPAHPVSPDTLPQPAQDTTLLPLVMVSLFNPAAWLDTVLVIGTAAAVQPHTAEPAFVTGALAASLAWFVVLAWLGRPPSGATCSGILN